MLMLSKDEARSCLVSYHNLDGSQKLSKEAGVMEYMKRVGSIQYDPLNVVGRNPDLVLQSRIKDYKPYMLSVLLYEDRSLIDGWDKMMCIYLTEQWPYFKNVREAKRIGVRNTLSARKSLEALELTEEIKSIIKDKGPLQGSSIDMGVTKGGTWGHKRLSSAALDYMFNIGELGVSNKNNTQKVYDLIENLLPAELINCGDHFKSQQDFYKWYVKRRIGSTGFLWNKSGGGWLGYAISSKELRTNALMQLLEEGEIIEFKIEGIKESFFIRREDESYLNAKAKGNRTVFLAPLDNMLWDRALIKELFDFDYSWEVYVPVNKRKYGYYVLPVLYKNKLVARFEPEQCRMGESFKIKNWWWQEDIKVTETMKSSIMKAFMDFGKYLEAEALEEDNLSAHIYKN